MALNQDTFIQSKNLLFTQSKNLMRVCGMESTIELRRVRYSKLVPGFHPLFPDEGGTVTGQDLNLASRRRFRTRHVSRIMLWPSGDLSFTIDDTQAADSLQPSTTGGCTFDWISTPVAVINDGLFNSGENTRNLTPYYPENIIAQNSTRWEWDYTQESPTWHHYVLETRSNEIDFADEVATMREILEDEDLSGLWSADPGSGLNRLNRNITHEQWPFNEFDTEGLNSLDISGVGTYSGDMDSTDEMEPTGPQAFPAALFNSYSFPWGARTVTSTTGTTIAGSKAQWRSTNGPIDYCVLEFIGDWNGEGTALAIVHTEHATADAMQIVELPLGTLSGWGFINYGDGLRAVATDSVVEVYFGRTASEVIRANYSGAPSIPIPT